MDIIKTFSKYKLSKLEIATIIFLTFFRVGSLYFYTDAKRMLGHAKGPVYFILVAILVTLGTAFMFWVMLVIARKIFDYCKEHDFRGPIADLKRNYIKDSIFLFICWLPNMIMKFPGAMNCDAIQMYANYFDGEYSEHHSVMYTFIQGSLIAFFEKFTHGYWGLFVFVMLHYALYVVGFAYLLYIIRKMRAPSWFVILTKMLCILNPYIVGYIGVALKDSVYSVLVMISILIVIDHFIDAPKNLPVSKYVLLGLVILAACLTRKNGIYVFAISALLIYVSTYKEDCHEKMRISVVLGVLAFCIANIVLVRIFNPIPSNVAEMLSIPFQQTARFVRDYGDEVTDEEREIIDTVLEYDDLAERYEPHSSDNVKAPCRGNIGEIKEYFIKVWAKQFVRHPLCYVAATWEQNYYLFVPEAEVDNVAFYINGFIGYELDEPIVAERIDIDFFPLTQSELYVHFWSYDFYKLMNRAPIINIFWNVSTAFYWLVLFTVEMIQSKKKAVIMIPLWMTVAFIIIGPVIQGHPRYMFPIIYTLPAITCFVLFFKDLHTKNTRGKNVKKSRK